MVNLAFHAGSRSTLISPLVPLGILVFTSLLFLPVVWFALKVVPKRIAIIFPPIAVAACCATYVALFPEKQTSLSLLAIETFIYALLPMLAASVVSEWVWVRPSLEA
jgi:hypothetical protein